MGETRVYDMSMFEEKRETRQVRNIRITPPKKKPLITQWLSMALTLSVLVALVVSILNAKSELNVISNEVNNSQAQLEELQGEYNYLNATLQTKVSKAAVEEYATTKLGLIKTDSSQIVYYSRVEDNLLQVQEGAFQGFWDKFSSGFMNAMEYIVP